MAPVSVILHSMGIRMLRYLDDWLVQASSRSECLCARDQVLLLCRELGIVVNLGKSQLTPTQVVTYLGMVIDATSLRVSPTPTRIQTLVLLVEEFLSSERQPAAFWRRLLGHLSSMTQLIPGGRLRMRSLQLILRQSWNFQDEEVLVAWSHQVKVDLSWWIEPSRLQPGSSLEVIPPDLMFWSDASDEGWGAHLADSFVSGLRPETDRFLSINLRELRAIRWGLAHFRSSLEGKTVAVFSDSSTAVSYLRKQGGTISPSLNEEAQKILRWADSFQISVVPQFIQGKHNVLADSLSRQDQVIGSEWTLVQDVVDRLIHRWPATVDLFATSINYRLPVYYAPLRDPQSAGTDALLQSWSNLQAYAFPPFSLVRQVVNKWRASANCDLTLIAPFWPQKECFPDLLESLSEPPLRLPERRDLLRQPHFHRFHLGLRQLNLHAWRLSSGSPGMRASLVEWLSRSPLREGDLLA